jgi:hypothetical protein
MAAQVGLRQSCAIEQKLTALVGLQGHVEGLLDLGKLDLVLYTAAAAAEYGNQPRQHHQGQP